MTHLAFGSLVDYVRGLGAPAMRDYIRDHLALCPLCDRSVSRLLHFAEIACAEFDCDAPDTVEEEAIALFTAEPAERRASSDVSILFRPVPSAGIKGRPTVRSQKRTALSTAQHRDRRH